MNEKAIPEFVWKKQIENSLKQEFEQTLEERVNRWMQVQLPKILPYHEDVQHFVAPSAECSLLFREGHFYGCIALVQAVVEALVRFVWEKNNCRGVGDFEQRVRRLHKKEIISSQSKDSFLKIWDKRNDYHHLNSNVRVDQRELEVLARTKVYLLAEVEKEIFDYTLHNGIMTPRKPKYWKLSQGQQRKRCRSPEDRLP